MEKIDTTNNPEYRKVQARELILKSKQLDGQRIVLMDYLDGRYKGVVTPEHLSLGLDTSSSPEVAKQLETLSKRLYLVRLWGVFKGQGGLLPNDFSLEVHSLELLPELPYLKVTWAEVYANPQKYDRARVEYTGRYVTSFESLLLDGVWLESSPYVIQRDDPHWRNLPQGGRQTKVRVRGVLHTQEGGYGHDCCSLFLLRADEIDYLENIESAAKTSE